MPCETKLLQYRMINDKLVLCLAMILTMHGWWILVFHKEVLELHTPRSVEQIMEKSKGICMFPKMTPAPQILNAQLNTWDYECTGEVTD